MKATREPRLGAALISLCSPPQLRDVLLGDLLEELEQLRGNDERTALRWYRGQVLRSIGPLLWSRIGSSPLTKSAAVLLAGLAAAVVGAIATSYLLPSRIESGSYSMMVARVALCSLSGSIIGGCMILSLAGAKNRRLLIGVGCLFIVPELAYSVFQIATRSPDVFLLDLVPLALTGSGTIAGLVMSAHLWPFLVKAR